jgi:D-3-phosphoglycerate dehydrogenase / 2-oxoglutarate reductase
MAVVERALLLEPSLYAPEALLLLTQAGVDYELAGCPTQEDLIERLTTAQQAGRPITALFARLGLAVDAAVVAAGAGALRWVVTPTTGLDHIDVAHAQANGVHVLSLKEHPRFLATISSTAELTFALLLGLCRHLPAAHADVLAGQWRRLPFPGRELRTMTLGIVGLGRLGTLVAGYARAFGMNVLGCDERDQPFNDPANRHVKRCPLDSLLADSDVVSLHLPLNQDTLGILDGRRIALLRRGAVLINTARGELIDERALLGALEDGTLAGCALDVLAGDARWDQGVPAAHPLVEYARRKGNLILTPHIGGFTSEALTKTRRFMVERYCETLSTEGAK